VVAVVRSKPHARTAIQPQPSAFGLSPRYFEPLAAPDARDPVFANRLAPVTHQRGYPPVAVVLVAAGERDDRPGQRIFSLRRIGA
jgi:hypothetical protein